MKARKSLMQVGALLVVGALAFAFIAFGVVQWRVGVQNFKVTVMLPRAGGIYSEALVDYRGVSVGKVTGVDLHPGGVAVQLSIKPGTRIPADSSASVRELTAAGEQYMDLVPGAARPPYLHNGSVIRSGSVPVTVGTVLSDTGSLLASLNAKDIQTINQALATGFYGTGGDLRNIIVAGQNSIHALEQAEPSTVQLIVSGETVLKYLNATNGEFATFARGLDELTTQIRNSNGDINKLLTNGVSSQQQVSKLLSRYSGSFQNLSNNLATVGNVGNSQQPALKALFQVLPVFARRIGATTSGGHINVELYFNNRSPVCTYIPASQMPSPTQASAQAPLGRTCGSGGSMVRGAANVP